MMGLFTTYALYVSLFLLIGYLIYKWLMAGEKQMRLNRIVLLSIYAFAFIAMPVAHILSLNMPVSTGEIEIEKLEHSIAVFGDDASIGWLKIIVILYLAGVIAMSAWTIFSAWRIKHIINSGNSLRKEDNISIILLENSKAAPFSWLNYIAMTYDDYKNGGPVIIAHELAHIHHHHCIDLIIAQIVCILQWFNPAAWLMREELKSVHEFQADDTVLSSGIEPRHYQMLLIKKAVGIRFQSLANSLNHSNLKKRITMMYNQKSSAGRRMRALAIVPALGAVLSFCQIPAVASVLSATSTVTLNVPANSEMAGKITEISVDSQNQLGSAPSTESVLPKYPGDENAMISHIIQTMRYPEDAIKNKIEGLVTVKFIIAVDGSICDAEVVKSVNPLLDAEALRVINAMPNWIPGKVDGRPAAVSMVLPINFKLSNEQ